MRGVDVPVGRQTIAGVSDSRRTARQKAVLLVCRLVSRRADDLCLVSDISEFGAKAQTAQNLRAGDQVAFEFGNLFVLHGTVRWVRDRHVGVEFSEAAELSILLSADRHGGGARGRARGRTDTHRVLPRVRRCVPVRLYLQGRAHNAELRDLSPGGAGIDIGGQHCLQAGDWVNCEIEGIDERTATIRWVDGSRLGLSFDSPLPLRPLDEWLVATVDHCPDCGETACPAPMSGRPDSMGPGETGGE